MAPVLLVADDLSTIAAVKRALARDGYEVILATSAADAVIAWGHHLPGLVVIQPTVESDRGAVVLEELQQHPDAQLLRVVLLGESLPGFAYHVEPLPLEADHFVETVQREMRAAEDSEWTVSEPRTETNPAEPQPAPVDEPEPWRATRPAEPAPADAFPQTQELVDAAEPTPPTPEPASEDWRTTQLLGTAPADTVSDDEPGDDDLPMRARPSVVMRLFGDLPSVEDELHRDVEAQAIANVESSLPPLGVDDDELKRLEDDVRAEAARRRAAREAKASETVPQPELTPPLVEPVTSAPSPEPLPAPASDTPSDETSFAEVSDEPSGAPVSSSSSIARPPDSAAAREVLAKAEAISLEGRAVAQAQKQAAEADRRRIEAELDALKRRAENAESLVRREREARAGAEDQLEQLREESRTLTQTLDTERREAQQRFAADLEAVETQAESRRAALEADLSARLESAVAELAEKDDAVASLRARLDDVERALDVCNATAVERVAEHESLLSSLTHEQAAAKKAEDAVVRLRAELDAATQARHTLEATEAELTKRLEGAVAQLLEGKTETETAMKLASEAEAALSQTREALEAAVATQRAAEAEAAKAQALAEALAQAEAALEAERSRTQTLTKDTVALKDALETQRARADEAEALAQLTTDRLKALEHKQVMNLALPGRRALGVPRHGEVSLEQLAHLISTLVASQADVRLELGASGGTRTLWFKKGALHGAESSFDHESLIDRARRDGLIDARQEAELRLLRTATAAEQLEALKGRGLVREIETVPLLQRATEAISLEAFSEESTQYRLSDEPPGQDVLLVAVPRSTMPLLAEALRRAVPTDALLERLGGADAVCVATDHEWDLRALGFADKERKMLTWVDGEATVEDLTLAAGLKQETAFRALLVASWLGVIELKVPERPAAAPSPDLELRRLEAKYDEVQDADYFTILGLARSATSDDVQRAYRRLSEEFDPIKFTGHPDPSLQQRAQVVSSLLEEAAKALEDERRRAEYARHLLD